MKRILAFLTAAAFATQSIAGLATLKAGATSQQVEVRAIVQSTNAPDTALAFNTAGLSCSYHRPGATSTSITLATQTLSGAYSSGGFVHDANGWYRLDIPDAALATGVPYVQVTCAATGDVFVDGRIDLSPAVDVESWNGTATGTTNPLPNAAAGASGGLLISGTNSGTTTLGALTVSGNTTFTGTTTYTGAITGSNASNNFRINGVAPGAAGGLFIAGTNAPTTITTGLTTTFTGNLTGSVGSVTGAVGSVTGAVGSVTGNVGGNVTGSVGSIASGGISEASYATTTGSFAPLGWTRQGTAAAASGSTSVTLDASAPFGDNTIIGGTLWVKGSTAANYWQACTISAYVASTQVATVSCPSGYVTPTGTITYRLAGTAPFSNSAPLTANVTQWNGSNVATPDTAGYPKVTIKSGTGTGEVSLSSGQVLLQPTQTGVTIPNVTTVGTTTNVTNAPTSGDLTAAMKASVTAAVPTATQNSDAVLNGVAEPNGSVTVKCVLATTLAYGAGTLTTSGGSSTYKDPSGTSTRISGTVSSPGNRTATITCPP